MEAASPQTNIIAPDAVRARVLVADDNPVNQKLVQRMLQKLGCHVDIAATGREALKLAQDHDYDIIFMDCSMPEMDGYEATMELRRLQGTGTRVPIVALTGHATEEDRLHCMEVGMDDYLSKPAGPNEFRAALDRWTKSA